MNLTKYMDNSKRHSSPWADASRSAKQKIPCLFWIPNVHYRVQNSPPLVSILSQMNLVHTFPIRFPKIHSNIIFSSTPRSSEWSLPFKLFNQKSVCIYHRSHACYMPHPLILLDLITLIIFGEAYKLRSSSSCSLLQPPATPSVLRPNSSIYVLLINFISNKFLTLQTPNWSACFRYWLMTY